jgi:hypothetical protein
MPKWLKGRYVALIWLTRTSRSGFVRAERSGTGFSLQRRVCLLFYTFYTRAYVNNISERPISKKTPSITSYIHSRLGRYSQDTLLPAFCFRQFGRGDHFSGADNDNNELAARQCRSLREQMRA